MPVQARAARQGGDVLEPQLTVAQQVGEVGQVQEPFVGLFQHRGESGVEAGEQRLYYSLDQAGRSRWRTHAHWAG